MHRQNANYVLFAPEKVLNGNKLHKKTSANEAIWA